MKRGRLASTGDAILVAPFFGVTPGQCPSAISSSCGLIFLEAAIDGTSPVSCWPHPGLPCLCEAAFTSSPYCACRRGDGGRGAEVVTRGGGGPLGGMQSLPLPVAVTLSATAVDAGRGRGRIELFATGASGAEALKATEAKACAVSPRSRAESACCREDARSGEGRWRTRPL